MPYPVAAARGGKSSGRGTSSLLTGLVAYWPMSEVSGNRSELINSYTLTDVGSVASAGGKLSSAAADFDMATDMGLKRLRADAALINFGGPASSFTLAAWTYPTAFSGGPDSPEYYREIMNFCNASYVLGGYLLMTTAAGQLYCDIGSHTGVPTDTLGWHVPAPFCTPNEWQLIIFAYDGPTGAAIARINASESTTINAHAVDSSAATDGDFYIGTRSGTTYVFDGRIGPAMIWSRVLTSAEMTDLYNGGAGLAYPF